MLKTMLEGAFYIRVSTNDQTEFSPDAQKRALFEYAKRNKIHISEEHIFIDEGISGRKADKRPEFQRMIKLAKSKKKPFDIILVHRFDRFARNREDSVVYKSLLRREHGIKVVSITEQLEDDKFSLILEAILEAMAEYYSLNLAEEVTKGMKEKAMQGGFQAKAPLGYEVVEKGKPPVIVKKEKLLIEIIFNKFFNESMTYGEICRHLNDTGYRNKNGKKFESRAIKYILENPIYAGYTRWNYRKNSKVNDESEWIIAIGQHKSIVSKDLWEEVQERIKLLNSLNQRTTKPTRKYKHWLSGFMKCKYCGGAMTYGSTHGTQYYRCNKAMKGSCHQSNYINLKVIEEAILEQIKIDMHDLELIVDKIHIVQDNSEIDMLKKQLRDINKKMKLAKKAYLSEIDTLEEYQENKKQIQKDEKSISKKLKALEKDSTNNTEKLKNIVLDVYEFLKDEAKPIEEKNKAIRSFVKKVVIDSPNDSFEIEYYIDETINE